MSKECTQSAVPHLPTPGARAVLVTFRSDLLGNSFFHLNLYIMLPTSRRLLGRVIRPPSASVVNHSRVARPVAAFATSLVSSSSFSTSARAQQATAQDLHKTPSPADQFATGNNAYYAEEMYRLWKQASRGCWSRN